MNKRRAGRSLSGAWGPFIRYKAGAVGIAVELVNPQYTSQTCHQCLMLGSREGERFNCSACGECHADFNAACVISLGGAACKPPESATFVS